jgi:hypothetical protein
MTDLMDVPGHIRVGLRFNRKDAKLLRSYADRIKAGEPLGDYGTFHSAALAAESGEPLIVYCQTPDDANLMADGYVLWGATRPAIEELTGDRPPR